MGIPCDPAERGSTGTRHAVLLLAALNAVGAAGGAVALATGAIDLGELTARLPFDSPVFGGIALFVVVALPQSVLAVVAIRDDRRTPGLGLACGALLTGWILVEVAFLQVVVALHWIYLVIGLVQMGLGWSQVRRHVGLRRGAASPSRPPVADLEAPRAGVLPEPVAA